MPEVLDQKLAHITSGTVPCTHMSASNLLLWKMRIMDFGREVAASLSLSRNSSFLSSRRMPAQSMLSRDVNNMIPNVEMIR